MSETRLHVQWVAWDGTSAETFTLRWDNGGYVAEGSVSGPDIQYVMRLGPEHDLRQFLLFRDLDEPDLWLATDGQGRWGEMNGAERDDLRGCVALALTCSPSSTLAAVRSLDLPVGGEETIRVAVVDVDTLAVHPHDHTYTRLDSARWALSVDGATHQVVFDVDPDGVLTAAPGWFARIAPAG